MAIILLVDWLATGQIPPASEWVASLLVPGTVAPGMIYVLGMARVIAPRWGVAAALAFLAIELSPLLGMALPLGSIVLEADTAERRLWLGVALAGLYAYGRRPPGAPHAEPASS